MIKSHFKYLLLVMTLLATQAQSGPLGKLILFEQALFRLNDKTYYLTDFKKYVIESAKYKTKLGKKTILDSLIINPLEVGDFKKIGVEKLELRSLSFLIRRYIYFIKMKTFFLDNEILDNNLKLKWDEISSISPLLNQIERYFNDRFMVKNRELGNSSKGSINESMKLFFINLDRKIAHNVFF